MYENVNTNKVMCISKAIILSCAVIGVALAFNCIYYYQPDDYLMNYISIGAFGNGIDARLIYVNIVLGLLVTFFQKIFTVVNCYGALYVISVLFIYTVLYYVFFLKAV